MYWGYRLTSKMSFDSSSVILPSGEMVRAWIFSTLLFESYGMTTLA